MCYGHKMKTIHMSINRWMNKPLWYIRTMKYYLAINRNESMREATTWMNPNVLKLSVRRKRKTESMSSVISNSRNAN